MGAPQGALPCNPCNWVKHQGFYLLPPSNYLHPIRIFILIYSLASALNKNKPACLCGVQISLVLEAPVHNRNPSARK